MPRNDRYDLVATNYPCPEPGWEHTIVEFVWKGRPAHWEDGNVWALKQDLPRETTWVQNLDWIMAKEAAKKKGGGS